MYQLYRKTSFLKRAVFSKIIHFIITTALLLYVVAIPNYQTVQAGSTGQVITDLYTDKAMYSTGQTVTIYAELKNNTGSTLTNTTITLTYKQLTTTIGTPSTQTFSLNAGATTTLTFTWNPPTTDFQGYMVEAVIKNSSGVQLDSMNTAVDVSSTWTRFPRYGYLGNFSNQSSTVSSDIINQLNKYHINAIQYYDWQWKHHVPLAGTVQQPTASWNDIANRPTYRQTLLDYISAGHAKGIAAMNYNLMYGAYNGYGEDGSGVNNQWALCTDTAYANQWNIGMPGGWACTNIYMFNPGNTGWQGYINGRESDVFAAYPFDGWHVDQLGDWGTMYDYNGNAVTVKNTFKSFLNSAKSALNKTIVFNNVGNYGQIETAGANVDGMYTEMWEGNGQNTYYDVKRVIDAGAANTNDTKPVILAGYMNYEYAKTKSDQSPGNFNLPGVLLANATIFASGGSHIELGDDTRMLCNEYFPNRNLVMTDTLKKKMRNYYDFLVAYENLLRGGLKNIWSKVTLTGIATSETAEANKVWTFVKTGNGYDVVHFINLLGENSTNWRDTNANYPAPTTKTNVAVKYYYQGTVNSVAWASPDYENGSSFALSYTTGSDVNGNYVSFTVPSLSYWDMIYIGKASSPTSIALANPGFETGDLTGWTEWHPAGQAACYGVDFNDNHSGCRKLYFWNGSAYKQSVHQVKTGLANGSYTLKVWVKATNFGSPAITCRMEATNYGGTDTYTNMTVDGVWRQYSCTVNITNGQLDIGFYVDSPGSTSMQIDDVQLYKN